MYDSENSYDFLRKIATAILDVLDDSDYIMAECKRLDRENQMYRNGIKESLEAHGETANEILRRMVDDNNTTKED